MRLSCFWSCPASRREAGYWAIAGAVFTIAITAALLLTNHG